MSSGSGSLGSALLGRIMVMVGVLGVALGALVVTLGLVFVDRVAAGVSDGVIVADESISALSDTIELMESTVGLTAGGLEQLEGAFGGVEGSLENLEGVLGEMAEVVGEDLPGSVDALRSSFPQLIQVGDAIDRALRSLSVFGVSYSADNSIGDAFRDIDLALAEVPDRLRAQGELLDGARTELTSSLDDTGAIRETIGSIREELQEAQGLFSDHRDNVREASDLISRTSRDVDAGRPLARVALIVAGAMFAASQIVPIYLGRRLIREARA